MEYAPRVSSTAEVFGAMESSDFSILASGKAFSVLISGLYTNKVQSIVRELCANAFDGHIKAGNTDRPFDVHIPTRWQPHFSVRDYGCSMEHAFVMQRYTTLFYSTKDQNNEETGSFGLGCKSPFAYTTTFTVTTFLNGEKRLYTAYIDSDDRPRMVLNEIVETTEENGVLVSFPVVERDFQAFREAAQTVAMGYETPFNCPGANLHKLDYISRHGTFDTASNITGPLVRIGPVLYPLALDNEGANIEFARRDQTIMEFLKHHAKELIINLPIGKNQVTPSRESLSYTPEMIATLADRLQEITSELNKRVAVLFANCSTPWEYATAMRASSKQRMTEYERHCANAFMTPFGQVSDLLSIRLDYADREQSGIGGGIFVVKRGATRLREADGESLPRGEKAALVTADFQDRCMVSKLTHFIAEKGYDYVVLVKRVDKLRAIRTFHNQLDPKLPRDDRKRLAQHRQKAIDKSISRIAAFEKAFDCGNVVSYADLEAPPRVKRPKAVVFYEADGRGTLSQVKRKIAADDSVIYFVLKDRAIDGFGKYLPSPSKLAAALRLFNLSPDHIFYVAATNAPLLADFPNFKDARTLFTPETDTTEALDILHARSTISMFSNSKGSLETMHRRLSKAVSYCDPSIASMLDPVFKTWARLNGLAVSARKTVREAVESGRIDGNEKTDNDTLELLFMLMGKKDELVLAQSDFGNVVAAGYREVADIFPELSTVVDSSVFNERPEIIAAYLTGRALLVEPTPPEEEVQKEAA